MYALNYIEPFLNLAFAVTVCISVSALAFLVDISNGITSSTIGLHICAIISKIKNYQSIIKKKKKKHGEIALLEKTNLDCIKDSISRSLTDAYIECDYFFLVDMLREYDNMKEKINKLETS